MLHVHTLEAMVHMEVMVHMAMVDTGGVRLYGGRYVGGGMCY